MDGEERKAVKIGVPAENKPPNKDTDGKKGANKDAEQKLSEEDARVKEQVELLVTRTADTNAELAKVAIEQLIDLLRSSGGASVASVPRPLKYIRAFYPDLERALESSADAALTQRLHDVLSFVAMTLVFDDGRRVSLEHKLKGTTDDLAKWGHEYLRFLAGAIAEEWKEITGKTDSSSNNNNSNKSNNSGASSTEHLSILVDQITQYMIAHQDEPTAIDLLIEIDEIARVVNLIDKSNYKRIANYVFAIAKYLTRPTDTEVLNTVFNIYMKVDAYCDALMTALQLGDEAKIDTLFAQCTNKAIRLQMALLCARFRHFLNLDNEEDELLQEANGNMRLSQLYRYTTQELDSTAPKTPEEVFKTGEASPRQLKDMRYNLACAFVSGLANCGYGKDKYLTESDTFFFDQKEDRILTTTATLGLVHLWDYTEGLQAIDKYFYSESDYIKAGACLASGIVMCGVKNPFDPALGLLSENVTAPQREIALGAILGLGYAYAGMRKDDVKELLVPVVADGEQVLDVQCMAAYALAMVYVGSADEDITETLFNCLLEVDESRLSEPCVRYLILALGCMFLSCQEAADTMLDATQALSPVVQRYTEIVIRSCAFAATGNVIIVQRMFHVIAESDDSDDEDEEEGSASNSNNKSSSKQNEEKSSKPSGTAGTNKSGTINPVPATSTDAEEDVAVAAASSLTPAVPTAEGAEESVKASPTTAAAAAAKSSKKKKPARQQPLNYKAAAVLGIGLVAMGEELGEEMAKRAIIHALLADTVSRGAQAMSGRHAVPLVYALLSASSPNMAVVETLNRLAHDSDVHTATNAILAMGLVSAGSNNARVAAKLKSLAQYYQREKYASVLFVVRLAQGLCAMGKGHLTLSPVQNDRSYICPSAIMGLLGIAHSALDLEKTILDKYDYMLFAITPNIRPRMVIAVDETMEHVKGVQVRVGLPVDTVALPGKPKSITGFQTQTTPVLLSATDKVEVADSKYRAMPSVIDGVFVVEPKPQAE